MDAVAQPDRDRRPRGEPGRPEDDRLPAVEMAQRAQGCADDGEPAGRGLDHDAARLRRGCEQLGVEPRRDDGERPGEALPGGAGCDAVVRRDQAVDPREQTVPLRLAGREAETLGVDERRRRRRLGLEQRHVGQPRNAGVEAVDDVEVTGAERRRDARPHAHGDRRRRSAVRRGPCATARRRRRASPDCSARRPARRVRRPSGRREDDDRVAASSERLRDARDMLVRRVRHRPRMGRHEAEVERHGPGL